jgi:hypothetical protein
MFREYGYQIRLSLYLYKKLSKENFIEKQSLNEEGLKKD